MMTSAWKSPRHSKSSELELGQEQVIRGTQHAGPILSIEPPSPGTRQVDRKLSHPLVDIGTGTVYASLLQPNGSRAASAKKRSE